jgi:septal ring factor EnvC (AmiA/AmiB activator)
MTALIWQAKSGVCGLGSASLRHPCCVQIHAQSSHCSGAGVMSAAIATDIVQAAQRDASYVRLARQRVEAELAASTQHLQQLQRKLGDVQSQLGSAEQAAATARLAERQADATTVRLTAAEKEIGALHEQLKAVKLESSRLRALLKAAQVWKSSLHPLSNSLLW